MDIVCVCDKHTDGRTYNNDITRYCNFFDPLGWLLTGEWAPRDTLLSNYFDLLLRVYCLPLCSVSIVL